jgi:hypothetical protein
VNKNSPCWLEMMWYSHVTVVDRHGLRSRVCVLTMSIIGTEVYPWPETQICINSVTCSLQYIAPSVELKWVFSLFKDNLPRGYSNLGTEYQLRFSYWILLIVSRRNNFFNIICSRNGGIFVSACNFMPAVLRNDKCQNT